MSNHLNILLAFYGDDLTGSTDALEFICRAGAKTFLFLQPPTIEQLSQYPGLQAYGVAGLTRSLQPQQMEEELLPAFKMIKKTSARHVHYKVCSTFDSSPEIGSIGKAIDCGIQVFKNDFVPVLGGMPTLGRYCAFGNLFARMGIGSNGKIYRLDRHPSMSKHPITPANESDLRLHLGRQTNRKIGLIDIITMQEDWKRWNQEIQPDDEIVLLDAMNDEQVEKIGEWLEAQCRNEEPLFSVGSSGIEMALGNYWNRTGVINSATSWPAIENSSPLLVVSGSCSPVTFAQIEYAKAIGFEEVILETRNLKDYPIEESLLKQVTQFLQNGKDVVVHTGQNRNENIPSVLLGDALGTLAKKAIEITKVKRVIVAGGDTSSYVARTMGIEALEMIAPLSPGAPLCKVYSNNISINGIEINLKGGQVGTTNYFKMIKEGSPALRTKNQDPRSKEVPNHK